MTPPAFDDHLGFAQRVEDLTVQKLIPKLRVEAFTIAVLPRASRLDIGRSRFNGDDPLSNQFGDELRAIVRADMTWHAAQDEQVRKHIDDVRRVELSTDPDRQAFPRELVDHVEHTDLLSIVSSVFDEVVGPDVSGPLRPEPKARTVGEPKTASLRLLLWNLEPLPSPDPFNPLAVHDPAGLMQHRRDATIAVTAVLKRERNDVGGKRRLVVAGCWNLALRRTMLTENTAGEALRHAMLGNDLIDAGTATRGAQKFPEAASFRISFSSVRSETARRSRVFSASSSFNRLTWSPFRPPYACRSGHD